MDEITDDRSVPNGINIDLINIDSQESVVLVSEVPYFYTDENVFSFVSTIPSGTLSGSYYIKAYFLNAAGLSQVAISMKFYIRNEIVSASTTHFHFIYPDANAMIKMNESVIIKWNFSNYFVQNDLINITLWNENTLIDTIANQVVNNGIFVWFVGKYDSSFQYFLKIENVENQTRSSFSDNFQFIDPLNPI